MTDFATESIVRDLAAIDEPIEWHYNAEKFICTLCDEYGDRENGNHTDQCPWRRAREWVDANPPRVTPGWRL